MRKTSTQWLGNPMIDSFIVCKYSESESGEVKLLRASAQNFISKREAMDEALRLYHKDRNSRFVLLTELEFPANSIG
jgi:hypothetical protein